MEFRPRKTTSSTQKKPGEMGRLREQLEGLLEQRPGQHDESVGLCRDNFEDRRSSSKVFLMACRRSIASPSHLASCKKAGVGPMEHAKASSRMIQVASSLWQGMQYLVDFQRDGKHLKLLGEHFS